MGESLLLVSVSKEIPLIDVTVVFVDGIDYKSATIEVNELGEDLDLHTGDWYEIEGMRVGSATAEALYRLFGWKNIRAPLMLQNPETKIIEDSKLFCR